MLHTLLLIQKVALVGGTLHTMVPGEAPAVGTILIDHGLIELVGPDVKLPADAKSISIAGKHVIPGLVDGMVNFDADHDRLYLSCGVTLVRETGADLTQMIAERDSFARDRNPGPGLWIAGAILDGSPPSTRAAVVMDTREDAVDKASRLLHPEAGEGIDYFSYYPGLGKDPWNAVIALAHKESPARQVWGVLPKEGTLEDLLQAGQDGLFYIDALLPRGKHWNEVTAAELDAVARRVGESHMAVTPTLALYASRLKPPAEHPPELKYLGPIQVAQWLADREQRGALFRGKPELLPQNLAELKQRIALVKALHENKVALVPGSSCGMVPWLLPGEALLDELSLWAGSVGISCSEVLQLATRGSAERIGASRLHGTLAPGKWADLVVTAADPEHDLATLHQPDFVVIRGRVLAASELEDLRGKLAERQKELQTLAFKQPLVLPAPVQPPGEPVLSGMVETRYLNQRTSGERFAVARMSDGALVYSSRSLTFGTATTADTVCEVLQKIQNGRLVELEMTSTSGALVVSLKGTLAGGTLNIERRQNGVFQDMPRIRESVAFLDCGSVLTDLILGQSVQPGRFQALFLQDFEIAISDQWDLRVDPANGQHLLRGPLGDRVVSFARDGAPQSSTRQSGRGELARTLLDDSPVGSGLPVPKKHNPDPPKPK